MELHIDYWRTSMFQYTMQIITCIYLVPVCIV